MPDSMQNPLFSDFPATTASEWRKKIEQDLKGKPIDQLAWKAPDQMVIQAFYHREHGSKGIGENSLPGEVPFRRGSVFHADEPGWQIVQALQSSSETPTRLAEAIEAEVGAVLIQGDMANVGAWMEKYPLSNMAIHLAPEGEPLGAIQVLAAQCVAQRIPSTHLTGTLAWDCVTQAALQGKKTSPTQIKSLAAAISVSQEFPYFRSLGIDLTQIGERGANASYQLAIALAATAETIDLIRQQNPDLSAETLAENLHYVFPMSGSFFLEVGKFRAFRVLISTLLSAYGLDSAGLLSPFVMARSGKRYLAHYDRHNNLLRHTTAAMSAILGGVEAVALDPFDVLEGEDTKAGTRLARNIQFLLKHESYLDQVQDAGGGAYYVEEITNQLANKAWEVFQAIEAAGGLGEYATHGMLNLSLAQQSASELEAFNKRKKTLIGVNESANPGETMESLEIASGERRVAAALESLRAQADRFGLVRGKRLTAFTWQFGEIKMRSARAQFSRNLLAAGGIDVIENQAPDDLEASQAQLASVSPEIVVLCSADPAYTEMGPTLIAAARAASPDCIVLIAGKPEGWESLGANDCIFAGIDAQAFLSELLSELIPS